MYGRDENADKVKELILQNKRLTVLETAKMLEISLGTIQSILKQILNMCHIPAKYVPHVLRGQQKESNVSMNKANLFINFSFGMIPNGPDFVCKNMIICLNKTSGKGCIGEHLFDMFDLE